MVIQIQSKRSIQRHLILFLQNGFGREDLDGRDFRASKTSETEM